MLKGIEDARTKGISGSQLSAEALKLDKQFLQVKYGFAVKANKEEHLFLAWPSCS